MFIEVTSAVIGKKVFDIWYISLMCYQCAMTAPCPFSVLQSKLYLTWQVCGTFSLFLDVKVSNMVGVRCNRCPVWLNMCDVTLPCRNNLIHVSRARNKGIKFLILCGCICLRPSVCQCENSFCVLVKIILVSLSAHTGNCKTPLSCRYFLIVSAFCRNIVQLVTWNYIIHQLLRLIIHTKFD